MGLQQEPAAQVAQDIADTPAKNPIFRLLSNHPTGFWFFFWGEFAERCSYYGMRAILALYMADQLALGEANSATYLSTFLAACYFLPVLGGWVADRFLGKYWTIVGFSLPYIVGQVIVGIESTTFLAIALALLAMGSGVIKPNISTLMGLTYDQQRPGQTKLRSDAFAIFYFSINIGAALSSFAMPKLRNTYGYSKAFLFPAALMAMAFAIFAAGKRFYGVETVGKHETSPEAKRERWRILGRVAGLFFLVMFFWAVFDQASSTWIFFGQACMNLKLFGVEVAPDQIQAFNPVFILILLPPITLFFKYLDKRGLKVRPTDKMLVGFLLTAGCMGIMALAAVLAGPAERRPAILQGKDLKLAVVGGATPVVIEGRLRASVVGSGEKIVVQREAKVTEDGKVKFKKEKWNLLPSEGGVLRMVAVSDDKGATKAIQIEGDLAKVEKPLEDKKTATLAVGKLQASVGVLPDGTLTTESRWFVAPDKKVTVWWQVFAYLIITVAEVLISVTGLELGYTAAPKSMTGFVTGLWLFTVGMGNLFINVPVTRLYPTMQPMNYFGMLAVTLLVVSVGFLFVARRFNRGTEPANA